MANIVKKDIHGSSVTRGDTLFNSRAVRICEWTGVDDLPGTDIDAAYLAKAIDDVLLVVQNPHPTEDELPRHSVTAVRTGPRKVLLRVNYLATRANLPNSPTELDVTIRTITTAVRCYRIYSRTEPPAAHVIDPLGEAILIGANLPGGDFNGLQSNLGTDANHSEDRPPQPWILHRPALSITVRTVTAGNPYSDGGIFPKIAKINENPATFNDISGPFSEFPAGTLRFDGLDVQTIRQGAAVQFVNHWQFTGTPHGFVEQGLQDVRSGPGVFIKWSSVAYELGQRAPFEF